MSEDSKSVPVCASCLKACESDPIAFKHMIASLGTDDTDEDAVGFEERKSRGEDSLHVLEMQLEDTLAMMQRGETVTHHMVRHPSPEPKCSSINDPLSGAIARLQERYQNMQNHRAQLQLQVEQLSQQERCLEAKFENCAKQRLFAEISVKHVKERLRSRREEVSLASKQSRGLQQKNEANQGNKSMFSFLF